ncbi:hypothetical protein [Tautonia sociabilis]|uniref:Uncharacterized protein n=1 Tax=Tautonia sociabilis TaxID=2080755 RepID=A0A432MFR6_9BACT|nr:hypothetical protein [Tautonia sociabilis]RUL84938.1 hypothetical protein TsocGM_19550 [Tautonia sociabilis]
MSSPVPASLTTPLLRLDPNLGPAPPSGPLVHRGAVRAWADLEGGAAFLASEGGFSWLGDCRRVRAAGRGASLSRPGVAASGRPSWTIDADLAGPFGFRAVPLYREAAADHSALELRIDPLGHPEVAIQTPGQPEAVARCPRSLAPRWPITSWADLGTVWTRGGTGFTTDDDGDGNGLRDYYHRSYRINLASLDPETLQPAPGGTLKHPFVPGDEVLLGGFGFIDGHHVVSDTTPDSIYIVVTTPTGATNTENTQANPTTIGARSMSAGSGSDLTAALSRRFESEWSGGDWTLSGWFRQDSTGIDGAGILCASPIGDARATGTRVELVYQSGYVVARIPGTALEVEVGPAIQGQWHHYTLVHKSAAQTLTPYFDGEPYDLRSDVSTSTEPALRLGDTPWILAARVTPDRLDIDQVLYASGTDVRLRWVAAAQQYRLDVNDGIAATDGSTVNINGSFESPVLPTNTFKYLGTNENWGGWVRSAANVAISNGVNAFTTSTVYSQLDGQQCLILQNLGSVYRDFEAPDPANYTFQFWTIRRGNFNQTLKVFLDGVQLGADITVTSTAATITRTFSVPAGTHRIEIKGMVADQPTSAYIDRVVLTRNSVAGTIRSVSAAPAGGQANGVSHDVIAAYDPVTEEISLRIDGGAPVTTGGVTAVAQTATSVGIGCNHDGSSSFWGALDPIALHRSPPNWSTALAAVTAEFDGAGPGPTYAGLGGSYAADTGLVAWYEGTPGSTRVDSHSGGYDLTNTTIRIGGPLDLSGSSGAASVWSGIGIGFNQAHTARFGCSFDGIGLWLGRALAGPDVAALFGEGPAWAGLSSGSRSGIWSFYNCDERGGDLLDASGNGRDLINVSGAFPAVAGVPGFEIAFSAAPDTPMVRMLGRRQMSVNPVFAVADDQDSRGGWEWHRYNLSVVRDGTVVRFYRNGEALGTATIDAARLGPSSGTTTILQGSDRLLATRCDLFSVSVEDGARDDATALDENRRRCFLPTKTRGPGPLGVQFLATWYLGGVQRSELAHCRIQWEFYRAGTRQPHDDRTLTTGQGYCFPTGFFCSQVFRDPGEYDCYVTIARPPHDRSGARQAPQVLWSGKFATITVEEWPAQTTDIYVDTSLPTSGDGSIGSPLNSVDAAIARWVSPYTRIFLKAGTSFTKPAVISGKHGPALITRYGDGPSPRLRANVPGLSFNLELNGVHDLRITDLTVRPDDGYYGSFLKPTDASSLTVLRCNQQPSDIGWGAYAQFYQGVTAVIIDDHTFDADVYGFYMDMPGIRWFSSTRADWSGKWHGPNGSNDSIYHIYRTMGGDCLEIRGLSNSMPPTSVPGIIGDVTIRYTHHWTSVTDSDFSRLVQIQAYAKATNRHAEYGTHGVLVERCDLVALYLQGTDDASVRDCTIGRTSASEETIVYIVDYENVRLHRVLDVRYHDIRIPQAKLYRTDSIFTDTGNVVPLVFKDRTIETVDGTATAPASIEAVVDGGGAALLTASGPPRGDRPLYLAHRWAARRAGTEAAFTPIAGQVGSAAVFRPTTSGDYEFRLDAIDVFSGSMTIGGGTATATISAPPVGPGYTLRGPDPATGLAGQPSGPFVVEWAGGEPPSAPVVVTPSSDSPGTFDPPQVSLSGGSLSAEFRFIPDGAGTRMISTSNDAGLPDPAPLPYTATIPVTPSPGEIPSPTMREMEPEPVAPGGEIQKPLAGRPAPAMGRHQLSWFRPNRLN